MIYATQKRHNITAAKSKCTDLENKAISSPICDWTIILRGLHARWTLFLIFRSTRYNSLCLCNANQQKTAHHSEISIAAIDLEYPDLENKEISSSIWNWMIIRMEVGQNSRWILFLMIQILDITKTIKCN